MRIEKLVWISEVAQEAELIISDGQFTCIAFSQPCDYNEGDSVDDYLHAFMSKNIMLSQDDGVSIRSLEERLLSHKCTAVVESRMESLVRIGNIIIELDSQIPAGVEDGMLVDFECARLDLW
tara:strand:+ start:165 stop:530 length:366 start_codon:yes stop_codon:yes gene_type:complete